MEPRRGLVLGAGGVLGAAWTLGALSALQQAEGWDPREADVLIGTSAGSVVAAALGCGVGVEALLAQQALRAALDPRCVTPMAALSAVLPQGRGSLAPLGAFVDGLVPPGGWAPHPRTWIVAMDHDSGRRVVFGRPGAPPASLREAVLAACSLPGWYAPVRIGGRRYVDGGACSPTSLDLVTRAPGPGRLDEVVVLSPMTSLEQDAPVRVAARIERRFRRLVTKRLSGEVERVTASGTRVVLLCPGPEDLQAIGADLMDPCRREQVLETSLRTSAQALARARAGLA